jgi:hypothetical protein
VKSILLYLKNHAYAGTADRISDSVDECVKNSSVKTDWPISGAFMVNGSSREEWAVWVFLNQAKG